MYVCVGSFTNVFEFYTLQYVISNYTSLFYMQIRFEPSLGNNDVIYYIKCLIFHDFEPRLLIKCVLIK